MIEHLPRMSPVDDVSGAACAACGQGVTPYPRLLQRAGGIRVSLCSNASMCGLRFRAGLSWPDYMKKVCER